MSGIAGTTQRDTEVRLPKATRVKNKQPAERQITSDQILREAKELRIEDDFKRPRSTITDPAELAEYRLRKRKEFEDQLRRVGRFNSKMWVKYAQWEESQKDFRRARSIWERTLKIYPRDHSMWLKYAEMEMRHGFVNHARNVWDRAVSLLPRIDQLWYKYIHMEEMLGNVPAARQIFERWMEWEPDHHGWMAYIKMEFRYNEPERARQIFEKYVQCLPSVKAWVNYAKFECKIGQIENARQCYERAAQEIGEDSNTDEFYTKWADFEERIREFNRARHIYKYALKRLPKEQAMKLYEKYVLFEKQYGTRQQIEDIINEKRRFEYEEELQKNPNKYDTWFDYLRLSEAVMSTEQTREAYQRAVSNLPPTTEKYLWQRYVYIWIYWALFEELQAKDTQKARIVYQNMYLTLQQLHEKKLTFGKFWIMWADFEIRNQDLARARKILGEGIGRFDKSKIFRRYIEIELALGAVSRARKIFEKWLWWKPWFCEVYWKWADMEKELDEVSRARAIFEVGIKQEWLDTPETLWKKYIDFETEVSTKGDRSKIRALFERLLQKTQHVKVWLAYAKSEFLPRKMLGQPINEEEREEKLQKYAEKEKLDKVVERESNTRKIYERAYESFKGVEQEGNKEAIAILLEAWKEFEQNLRGAESELERLQRVENVDKKMPRRVKRRRPVFAEDGSELGLEEYFDYIMPEEEGMQPVMKILQAAQQWKKQRTQ